MGNKKDASDQSIPYFSASWDDGDSMCGVDTQADGLWWSMRPNGPGGHFGEVGTGQSIEDFLTRGPAVGGAPTDVVDRLFAVLEEHGITLESRQRSRGTPSTGVRSRHQSDIGKGNDDDDRRDYERWLEKNQHRDSDDGNDV